MAIMSTDIKNVLQNSMEDDDDPPTIAKRPHIYDGEYFEIVSRDKDALIIRCLMCGPDGALLRAALTSSSNILKHVKRKHPDKINKLKAEKKIKSRTPRSELRLKLVNTGTVERRERDTPAKAYAGPTMKIKQQPLIDEQNDTESDAAMIDLHDVSADDQEQEYEYAFEDKMDERSIELINYEEDAFGTPSISPRKLFPSAHHQSNKELLELHKHLLERDYNDVQALRLEKHQLEMSILKADLAHKTMEHQKRMDILNKRYEQS